MILKRKEFSLKDRFSLAKKIYRHELSPESRRWNKKDLEKQEKFLVDLQKRDHKKDKEFYNQFRDRKLNDQEVEVTKQRNIENARLDLLKKEKAYRNPRQHALKTAIKGAFLSKKQERNDWKNCVNDYTEEKYYSEIESKGREETKKKYEGYIEQGLSFTPNPNYLSGAFKEIEDLERKYKFSFKRDLEKYIRFIPGFYKKNIATWYNILKPCGDDLVFSEPLLRFDELFPIPKLRLQEKWETDYLISTMIFGEEDEVEFDAWNRVYQYSSERPPHGQTFAKLSGIIENQIRYLLRSCIKKDDFYKEHPNIYRVHKDIINEYLRGIRTL